MYSVLSDWDLGMFFILGGCGLVNMYKIWNEKEEELFYVLEGKIC